MGFDLENTKGDKIHLNGAGWEFVHDVATYGGWEPQGTTNLEYPDWDGDYWSNDGQVVSAADALAMGRGIEHAIDLLAAPDLEPDIPTRRFAEQVAEAHRTLLGKQGWLDEFVEYLAGGEFVIN